MGNRKKPKEDGSLGLKEVVDALCHGKSEIVRRPGHVGADEPLPSRDMMESIVEDLRSTLFPGYFGVSELTEESMHYYLGATLDQVERNLLEQVRRGLLFQQSAPGSPPSLTKRANEITHKFLQRLPEVQRLVAGDVEAAFQGDPALTSPDEAIFCYPGVYAVTNHRLAYELHLLEVPLLPRMISENAHSKTGIDIHPGATIGERFFIDHGTGVVIGETSEIGNNVRIYQGVTLGAKSFPLDENGRPIKGIPRHPLVEDDVIIYAGATLLGRITIGRASVIGGNVWLTKSVEAGSRITQAQAKGSSFDQGAGI